MSLQTYVQTYATQPFPEKRRRTIKRLGWTLLIIELLSLGSCLLAKYLTVDSSIIILMILVLASIISIIFCALGIILYRSYYTFWYTPYRLGPFLWLCLILGGITFLCLFNLIAFVTLVVIFAVAIPQEKIKREAFVKSQSPYINNPTPAHIISYSDPTSPPQQIPNPMPLNSSTTLSTNSHVMSSANKPQPIPNTATSVSPNLQRELRFIIIALVLTILNLIGSTQVVIQIFSGIMSEQPSIHAAALGFGIFLVLPGFIITIVIFSVVQSRISMLRRYGLYHKGVIKTLCTITKITLLISTLPFISFLGAFIKELL